MRPLNRFFPVMMTASLVALGVGCEQQEFRMPPYVVQKDCEFTLVISPDESASTTIGKGNTLVTYKLSMGKYSVDVSDCRVVDNPMGLAIYED